MIDKRKAFTAGATLLAAIGVGQLIPSGDAIAAKMSTVQDEQNLLVAGSDQPEQIRLMASLPTPPDEAVLPIQLHRAIPENTSRVAPNIFDRHKYGE